MDCMVEPGIAPKPVEPEPCFYYKISESQGQTPETLLPDSEALGLQTSPEKFTPHPPMFQSPPEILASCAQARSNGFALPDR